MNYLTEKDLVDHYGAYVSLGALKRGSIHSILLCLETETGETVDQSICYGYTSDDGRAIEIWPTPVKLITDQHGLHRLFAKYTWAPLGVPINIRVNLESYLLSPNSTLTYTLERLQLA